MHPRSSACIFLLAAALGPLALAQEGPAVFRTETRLVVLHATVVDKHGKLVTDLPRSAFRVYEDGVEQPLKLFKFEDVPVSMGIVIDNSGSMRDKRRKVEAAAMALVKASNPQDEVFIVNFNDEAYLDVDFTSDLKKLEDGVARIDSRGGTAMRDAIDLSMDHLKKKGKRDKKVIVVVTDGNDNSSEITLTRLSRRSSSAMC
jgi:Ca-activated chloride channel family protein